MCNGCFNYALKHTIMLLPQPQYRVNRCVFLLILLAHNE